MDLSLCFTICVSLKLYSSLYSNGTAAKYPYFLYNDMCLINITYETTTERFKVEGKTSSANHLPHDGF